MLRNFLAAEHASRMDIGPSTVDWRLMQPNLAEALTINLLDGEISSSLTHSDRADLGSHR